MKNILVAIDFSEVTDRVVDGAVAMARMSGADLTLVHVAPPNPDFVGYEPGPVTVRNSVAHHLREEHRKLRDIEKLLGEQKFKTTALLIQGYAAEKILAEAARLGADMVVMGSHGHGLLRQLVVGSVTDGVLRKAQCPVLIVPAKK